MRHLAGTLEGRQIMKRPCIVLVGVLILAGCDSARVASRKAAQPVRLEAGKVEPLRGEGPAKPAVVPDFKRRFQVIRADKPPVLDGRLDDPAWSKAVVMKDFCLAQRPTQKTLPALAADLTEARVVYDNSGIYVGVKAFQDPTTITKSEAGAWQGGGDEIQLAIDPEFTQFSFYLFRVNPEGVRFKQFMPIVHPYDGRYKVVEPITVADDLWKAATGRDDSGWTAEVFIPYESIRFIPIRPARPNDIIFDMIQDRTIMGFNVHRISAARREGSSWSRSNGPIAFRDPWNFGQAFFRLLPCSLEVPSPQDLLKTDQEFAVRVISRSDKPEQVTLKVNPDALEGPLPDATVTLGPGETMTILKDMRLAAGDPSVVIQLIRASDGWLLDEAKFERFLPEPVQVVLPKTVLYDGEGDFWAKLTVASPDNAVDALNYGVFQEDQEVVSGKTGPLKGNSFSLPFTVSGLKPAEYIFEIDAVSSGKSLGRASQTFRVIGDPFSIRLSGRAGTSAGKPSGVPAGFSALAADTAEQKEEARPRAMVIPWLDEAAREKGFLWYADTPTGDFRGDEVPRTAELSTPFRAFAAGDEYEPISFVVHAFSDLKDLQIEFSDLRSKSRNVIPTSQMDLRATRVDSVKDEYAAWRDPLLVRQEGLGTLAKDCTRRYFLTIYVAPGTSAGLYQGTLSLRANGRALESRPYTLLVLPFGLEHPPLLCSVYGAIHGSADVERDKIVAEDLLSHGLANMTCGSVFKASEIKEVIVHHRTGESGKPAEERSLGDEAARFKVELDEQAFKNMKDFWGPDPIVINVNEAIRYLPATEEHAKLFLGLIQRIETLREKYGLPEFVYHLVDEPHNHYGPSSNGEYGRRFGVQLMDFYGKMLHELGVRQYATINSTWRGEDIAELVRERIDIWCANAISGVNQVDRWTVPGKELWLFNYMGGNRPKTGRAAYGFYAQRVRATGVTQWVHDQFVQWNPQEKRCLDRCSWEAIREGVDDARYVARLRKAIQGAKARGGSPARMAEAAEMELETIIDTCPVVRWDKEEWEKTHDASDWNKWRWIIASWILKLEK